MLLGTLLDKHGKKNKDKWNIKHLRMLADTGSTGSIIDKRHVDKRDLRRTKTVEWTTQAGKMTTSAKANVGFALPQLHESKTVQASTHVVDKLAGYDMIIGRDLLTELGIDLKFSEHTFVWEERTMQMPLREESDVDGLIMHQETTQLQDATARVKRILDAKHEKADLPKVAADCNHLDQEQKESLLALLQKHESLFDGTLGKWHGEEHDIELKPDSKPCHSRAFPVPKVHEKTLRMEVDRLCEAGVLRRVNRSEWGAPTFIIPKKDGSVRFITDF